jgi:uncharacterized cupredoxin-like copper-binding protein
MIIIEKGQIMGLTGFAAIALLVAPMVAQGHEAAAGKKQAPHSPEMVEKDFGRTGDPKRVTRTLRVEMRDTLRFTPAELRIQRGETVRIIARNSGQMLHELVLGNRAELKEHAELMKKFPDMEHNEPYMTHVGPGKNGEIVWQFTKAGDFQFACLVPGHFEAGMVGKIIVK